METSEHMRPVCTRPIDLSAVRTLHKLGLSAGDIGRDGASGFLVRDRFQKAVACCTPACSAVTEVKLKMQLRSELPELIVQMVADNERMAISKNLALHKVAIPSEQPAMFCHNTRDHRLVTKVLFVSRIVPEHSEPARQSAEHRIGKEGHRLNDRRIERRHTALYPSGAADFRDHQNLL